MLRTIDNHRDETGVLVRTQHVRIPMCIQGDKLPTTCPPGSRLWGQVPTRIGSLEKQRRHPSFYSRVHSRRGFAVLHRKATCSHRTHHRAFSAEHANAQKVLADADAIDGVMDASLMCGNPYAHEPRVGASVIVTGTASEARLKAAAKAIAAAAWAARAEFGYSPATPGGPVDEMVLKALADSVR